MSIQSLNPTTETVEKIFSQDTDEMIQEKIATAYTAYKNWRILTTGERAVFLRKVAELLEERKEEYAKIMAHEMGRPITAGVGEIKKCALVCNYYADNAQRMLEQEVVVSDTVKSYVRFDPLGIVLAVMPWNFPFWQVMRFAAPALLAGNVGLLKHASTVPQCA
ncbi:MAG: aldehyde dehydrogenase family protein, partial [Candidatus Uhrbacteria bacterium]|nr:aldehyde dehydrogenase family protein [Candidatus Uhrbacteria bacterium]